MTRRRSVDHRIPERRFIAAVRFTDGRRITTTIYGRNVAEAERAYVRDHPDVAAVIVHHESIG